MQYILKKQNEGTSFEESKINSDVGILPYAIMLNYNLNGAIWVGTLFEL